MKNCRNRNYENINKKRFAGIGEYDIPGILPVEWTGCTFIGFNYAVSCKNRKDTGIHFFLDDYQFLRLWNRIDYYLPLLKQFKYVMTPDFSTYADFPVALQIYNHYRKHWIGAYLQYHGINVIPTISWSCKESYEWCFDGEPTQGAVGVSAVGTGINKEARKMFLSGYQEMIKRLQPTVILFYGTVPEDCRGNGNIVRLPAFQEKFNYSEKGG